MSYTVKNVYKHVDNVDNLFCQGAVPQCLATSPAPIVINRSPCAYNFSNKKFSISSKVGKVIARMCRVPLISSCKICRADSEVIGFAALHKYLQGLRDPQVSEPLQIRGSRCFGTWYKCEAGRHTRSFCVDNYAAALKCSLDLCRMVCVVINDGDSTDFALVLETTVCAVEHRSDRQKLTSMIKTKKSMPAAREARALDTLWMPWYLKGNRYRLSSP